MLKVTVLKENLLKIEYQIFLEYLLNYYCFHLLKKKIMNDYCNRTNFKQEIIKIKKGKIINFFLLEKFKIVNILFINCTLD